MSIRSCGVDRRRAVNSPLFAAKCVGRFLVLDCRQVAQLQIKFHKHNFIWLILAFRSPRPSTNGISDPCWCDLTVFKSITRIMNRSNRTKSRLGSNSAGLLNVSALPLSYLKRNKCCDQQVFIQDKLAQIEILTTTPMKY